ncbi:hypothetical protein KCP73_11000 [Salmonella enterica subsp. enterica]|nr:hypothetical protein KCP73_11000 [Salmonella enterica subsp. enterica]
MGAALNPLNRPPQGGRELTNSHQRKQRQLPADVAGDGVSSQRNLTKC